MKDEFNTYFDDSFVENRELWATDPEKAHENQVNLVDELDARTGKKSHYDEASGIWYLSDGRRSDEIGTGLLGNSSLSPVFDYEKAESYRDYEDAEDKYENAEFYYNPDEDQSYQKYAYKHRQEGKKAMEDTLGRLSSATGGVAGSYAVSAASGTYNDYMDDISGKMAEFESRAYEKFKDKQDKYLTQMGLAEKKMEKEKERWEAEREEILKNEEEDKMSPEYSLVMYDFYEKGWDGLTDKQKLVALSPGGWYDVSTGILYDGAGNGYTSSYDPVKSALATYKTKGVKGLSQKDVDFLEHEGYKIRDGILYTPEGRPV